MSCKTNRFRFASHESHTHYELLPPPRLLYTKEAARFVSLSPRTMEKHRSYRTGPAYSKLGGRVVYRIADLQTWVALGARTSTSDVGVGVVYPAKARFRTEGGA